MDLFSDDTSLVDASLDREATSREAFLLEEGLEVLALYRAIEDPERRRMVRQLLVSLAWHGTRQQ